MHSKLPNQRLVFPNPSPPSRKAYLGGHLGKMGAVEALQINSSLFLINYPGMWGIELDRSTFTVKLIDHATQKKATIQLT